MRTIITLAVLALSFATIPAAAQEFKGDCRAYNADPAACKASGWCVVRTTKPVTTPDGQTIAPKTSCAFRPGFKAAWQNAQAK